MNSPRNELEVLVKDKSGTESDLQKKISLETIRELELTGYLSRGVTPSGEKVWSASREAQKDYKIYYSPPSFGEKVLGVFMYCIGLKVHL